MREGFCDAGREILRWISDTLMLRSADAAPHEQSLTFPRGLSYERQVKFIRYLMRFKKPTSEKNGWMFGVGYG